ncbi:putative transcription antiterminator BglG family protein [Streptococcus pneumoniae]|nr:putative transcription antiterminator BglG family protein [Streptococcus pneumoniae]VQD41815.1 putative transcription antiterminator BglG family protein [Streptococcus pneumoniae]VSV64867.1 putative transcription antiterminator BglG family protein [Streptococcus pneumoniae]
MSRKQEQMETLLLLLRDSKDYISAKVLGEKLNCSDKTVYRLVKGINKDCPIEAFILSEPKFQVEVSHPKEIHLATCSPSIF